MALEQIARYYESDFDYRWIWKTGRNLSMHYGYYEKKHTSHDQAVINSNRVMADIAYVNNEDIVLDAGCGIGGSSVWLAKNRVCKVVGINVIESQLEKAREWARQNDVSHLTKFISQNYLKTKFPDNSFTVVWGQESVCHSEDKREFLAEAKRLLENGGRLVIADYFLMRKPANEKEKKYLNLWLKGWAIPNIPFKDDFENYLRELGYKNILFTNVTEHVLPSSRRMYIATIISYPVAKILYFLGLRTDALMGNFWSAFYQYSILKRGLWNYGIFFAEK